MCGVGGRELGFGPSGLSAGCAISRAPGDMGVLGRVAGGPFVCVPPLLMGWLGAVPASGRGAGLLGAGRGRSALWVLKSRAGEL